MDTQNKIAIVLDTNFIIEHIADLREVHEILSENHDVYVTEISINERISQKYLELKTKYEKLKKLKDDYKSLATIKIKSDFDDKFESEKSYTLNGYKDEFKDKIVYFSPDKDVLNQVMDRVFKKTPPFLNVDNASDKGFKDTLLWLSIIDFFKDIPEQTTIIFVSNDKGFLNYSNELQEEFLSITGKNIEIKDNSYYKTLLGDLSEVKKEDEPKRIELSDSEKNSLREQISETIFNICHARKYDEYEGEYWTIAFRNHEWYNASMAKSDFEIMKNKISEHILESHVRPSDFLSSEASIVDLHKVSIEDVESAISLYEKIKNQYNEYMSPFLNAVCEIINRNYESPQEDDDLPF